MAHAAVPTQSSVLTWSMRLQALASRIFPKGIERDSAWARIEVEGNRNLTEKILNLTAIVG